MMGQLRGKVAIVTGAGTGLGASCAKAFAREGADLVLEGRRADRLHRTADCVSESAGRSIVVAGDVAEESTATRAVGAAVEAFGGVDVVVNNAGIHAPRCWCTRRPPPSSTSSSCGACGRSG